MELKGVRSGINKTRLVNYATYSVTEHIIILE